MQNLMIPYDINILEKYKLDNISKSGTIALITDYAILNGGFTTDEGTKGNVGKYFLNYLYHLHPYTPYLTSFVNEKGEKEEGYYTKDVGIRPVMSFKDTYLDDPSIKVTRLSNNILEAEYGTYLQNAPKKAMQTKLNNSLIINDLLVCNQDLASIQKILKVKTIEQTGEYYTRNRDKYKSFVPESIPVYRYQNKKYARVVANANYSEFILSNGEKYENGDIVWVEEQPVKWLINEEKDLMICDKIIQAGIRYNDNNLIYYNHSRFRPEINQYLDNYLAIEIFNSKKSLVKRR